MSRPIFRSSQTLFALMSSMALAGTAWGQGRGGAQPAGLERAEDVIEESVPDRPDLVKVTHIFRDTKRAKPAPGPACVCGGDEGAAYTLLKVKWFESTVGFNIYTMNSGVGAPAASAIQASFDAWKAAHPGAPTPVGIQISSAAGPGILLDAEQNVSWQPLSAAYGSNTLAVSVYWYNRTRVGGFSKIVHFDMAFNTDYLWTISGLTANCGGGSYFDIQNVGTHEAGHVLGMGHNNSCNLTMNPTAAAGETTKTTLAPGDVNGIKAIY